MADFNIQTSIPLETTTQLRCLIKGLRHIVDHYTDDDVKLTRWEYNTSNWLRDRLEKTLAELQEENKKKKESESE
jgi:hypothetical protein